MTTTTTTKEDHLDWYQAAKAEVVDNLVAKVRDLEIALANETLAPDADELIQALRLWRQKAQKEMGYL